jgi:DtxR family Mn-dependent transcriptional regulator
MAEQMTHGETAQMYLKAICELSTTDPLVPISSLAERLGISVVSATEMVHRMRDQRLLEHKRYKGIRLTEKGKGEALDIIRRHRIWECFLVDKLKLAWEDSHDLACQLEHAAGSEVIEAIATFLGQPTSCPHGNPIPTPEGGLKVTPGIPLESLEPDESGIVLGIRPETKAALSYLASHGIMPGIHITVKSINKFDRLWTLVIQGKEVVISKAMISRVVVGLDDESPKNHEKGKERS